VLDAKAIETLADPPPSRNPDSKTSVPRIFPMVTPSIYQRQRISQENLNAIPHYGLEERKEYVRSK
jgi:hypothetical protein